MVYNPGNMLLCPNCGNENRSEARFCRTCGQVLVEGSDAPLPLAPVGENGLPEAQAELHAEPGLDETSTEKFAELPAGLVLRGRYHLLSLLEATDSNATYTAEDLLRCWSCQAIQTDGPSLYCEACGADLTQKATVLLQARYKDAAEIVEESETVFVEGSLRFELFPSLEPTKAEPLLPALRLVSGYLSHPGRVRENNEDSLAILQLGGTCDGGCSPLLGFFAIADGVGGSAAGELASKAAIRSLIETVMQRIFAPEIVGTPLPSSELPGLLQELTREANRAILELRNQMNNEDMGCTLTAVLARDRQAVVANVGDSRTYQLKQGRLSLLTQDHSVVARLVEQGIIQPDEAYTHLQRSIIFRSLGSRADLEVDVFELEIEPGERLLLCSDGCWEMLRDPLIEEILLERSDPQQACDRLVELANLAGGDDNISVIVVGVNAAAPQTGAVKVA